MTGSLDNASVAIYYVCLRCRLMHIDVLADPMFVAHFPNDPAELFPVSVHHLGETALKLRAIWEARRR